MHEAPLVGRAAEVALVRSAVVSAAAGVGGVLVVIGEAGVGKSRLLGEAMQMAHGYRMRVLAGRAAEAGGAYRPVAEALLRGGADELDPATLPALAPYRAALGRLLPGWATGATGQPEPSVDPVLVLGEGVIRLLRELAGDVGCLVVLEDLHWADADTLALLEYFADRLRDLPLLVAGSARDDEPGSAAAHRLAAVRAAHSLSLSRLGPAELEALAATRSDGRLRADELAAVVARAEGLPLLVEELVDEAVRGSPRSMTAATAVPRTMAALVRRRLALLTASQRHCLSVAAVASTDPDWDCCRPCSGSRRTSCSPPRGPPRTPICCATTSPSCAGGTPCSARPSSRPCCHPSGPCCPTASRRRCWPAADARTWPAPPSCSPRAASVTGPRPSSSRWPDTTGLPAPCGAPSSCSIRR